MSENNSNFRLNGLNPLAYLGVNPRTPVPFFSRPQDPTPTDYANFILGTVWLNTANENIWMLVRKANFVSTWVQLSSGSSGTVISLTSNTGGAVMPTAGNINTIGDGSTIVGVGNPGTSTITFSTAGAVATSYITGSGTAIPIGGILNVLGGTGISTVGASNTVSIATTGSVATTYDGNSGTATPSSHVLNVVGDGVTATTAASGNTITITSLTSGGGGSVIDVIGGNNITITGTSTVNPTVNVSGTTNHCVQVGNSTGSLTSVANGTTGQVLTAQTGADPIWTSGGSVAGSLGFSYFLNTAGPSVGNSGYYYGSTIALTQVYDTTAGAFFAGTGAGTGSANGCRFTVPVTGFYNLSMGTALAGNTPPPSNSFFIMTPLVTTGVIQGPVNMFLGDIFPLYGGTAGPILIASGNYYLTAGQVIYFSVAQSSGNVILINTPATYVSGYRIA